MNLGGVGFSELPISSTHQMILVRNDKGVIINFYKDITHNVNLYKDIIHRVSLTVEEVEENNSIFNIDLYKDIIYNVSLTVERVEDSIPHFDIELN